MAPRASWPTILARGLGVNQTGRLMALGLIDGKRFAAAPEIPTIAESGVPGFARASGFIGLFAPAGTPTPIVKKLLQEGGRHSRNAERAGNRPHPDRSDCLRG
jgi:tripartite-type tricarboxylate transporter receptor subunit TctC